MNQPVDIYTAIRKLRLWLLFEPLDGLFGMYQRQQDAAGVVISVKVHPALQRYTAAHELGHHLMGHQLGIDPERHINRWTGLGVQELAAQMFAAEFLMPLAAVNAAAASLGVNPQHIDPVGVYQLSLRLRSSYSAMITRLQTLGWVQSGVASRFRKIQPKRLKQALLGRAPAVSGADVWLVTEQQKDYSLSPMVGDEVLFSLEEAPSTGYRWTADLPDWLSIERDEFVEPSGVDDDEIIGGTGRRELHVSVTEPRASNAKLSLRRQWESEDGIATLEVAFDAGRRPEPGVDTHQQPSLLAI